MRLRVGMVKKPINTKGGDKEAAGGGEGTKIIDINSVIGELIPQTMLQNSNKTKFTW